MRAPNEFIYSNIALPTTYTLEEINTSLIVELTKTVSNCQQNKDGIYTDSIKLPELKDLKEPLEINYYKIKKRVYVINSQIGSGVYKVYTSFSLEGATPQLIDSEPRVIKVIPKDEFHPELSGKIKREEYFIKKALGFADRHELNDRFVLEMPYVPQMSLRELLENNEFKSWDFNQRCQLAIQTIEAFWELEVKYKIIHFDVKPENLRVCLYKNRTLNEVKIIDYGLSVEKGQKDINRVGTLNYLPFEAKAVNDQKQKINWQQAAYIDRFSAGIVVLEIFDANVFGLREKADRYFSYKGQKSIFATPIKIDNFYTNSDLNKEAQENLSQALKKTVDLWNPARRLSYSELLKKLEEAELLNYKIILRKSFSEDKDKSKQAGIIFQNIEAMLKRLALLRRRAELCSDEQYTHLQTEIELIKKTIGRATDSKNHDSLYGLLQKLNHEESFSSEDFHKELTTKFLKLAEKASLPGVVLKNELELTLQKINAMSFEDRENQKEKLIQLINAIRELIFKVESLETASGFAEKEKRISILSHAIGTHLDDEKSETLLGLVNHIASEENPDWAKYDKQLFEQITDKKLRVPAVKLRSGAFSAMIENFIESIIDLFREVFGKSRFAFVRNKPNNKSFYSTNSTIRRFTFYCNQVVFRQPAKEKVANRLNNKGKIKLAKSVAQ